ncbi:MAG: hypothetical protein ACK4RZ_00130 [Paracoccaceae bacterium]
MNMCFFEKYLAATFVLIFVGGGATAQDAAWRFSIDAAQLIGSADAMVGPSPLVALRCVAAGAPRTATSEQQSVVLREVTAGNIGLMVTPSILATLAPGSPRPIDLAVSIDGQSYLTSSFAVAPPENALFSSLSGNHPVVNALREGSRLSLSSDGQSNLIEIGLQNSNSAIQNLLQYCGIVQYSQEANTVAEMDVDASVTAPAQVDLGGQAVKVDGRVAAVVGFSERGAFVENRDLKKDLEKLIAAYRWSLDDGFMRNDDAAISMLFASDIEFIERILLEARGRPLAPSEKIAIERLGNEALYGSFALTPFEKQRAVEAIRSRATEVMRRDLPPQPIPLRVYCRVNLGEYRFETAAFPISQNGCNGEIQGVPLPQSDVRSWPAFPSEIGFSPDEAEAFAIAATGTYLHNMSYDTDLTLIVHRSEAQSVVSAALSPRTNILLYEPGSITVPLKRLDTPEVSVDVAISRTSGTSGAPTAQTKAVERIVPKGVMPSGPLLNLGSAQVRAQLLAAAGDVQPLPQDERFRMASPQHTLAIIEPQYPFRIPYPPEQPGSGDLFFAYSGDHIPELADALGVPADRLISLSLINDNEPISEIVGLLPDTKQSFSRQVPADRYGRRSVGYTAKVAVTGVHAFQMPSGKPALVLSLHPFEGRFIDNSDSRNSDITLETFDLRGTALDDRREVLPIADRAAIVLKSLELSGQDPVKVFPDIMRFEGRKLGAFERQALLEDVIDRARQSQDQSDSFWAIGTVSFGEYDFSTGRFSARNVTLGTLEGLRFPDVPANRLVFNLDQGVFDLALDREAALAWTVANPSKTAKIRALLKARDGRPESGRYRLDVSVLEAELIKPSASARLRDPADVLHIYDLQHISAEAAASTVMPEAVAMPPDPRPQTASQRDVLGVRLGQSLDEAVELLEEQMGETQRYHATAELRSKRQPQPRWQSFSHATLLHAPEQMMIVALYSEPPASGETVTTIVRSQGFKPGAGPLPASVIDQLIAKYGRPQTDHTKPGARLIWADSKDAEGNMTAGTDQALSACIRQLLASYAQTEVLTNLARRRKSSGGPAGQQPEWFTETGDPWLPPNIDPLDFDQMLMPLSQCMALGEVTFAMLDVDADGLLGGLHVVISNPAEVGGFAAENEEAAVTAPASGAVGFEIKL